LSLITWVLVVNPFAETSVRMQIDRGQTVITSGPYRWVRHPMYVDAILMYFSNPLVRGSVAALLLGGIIACLMIARTAMEDGPLRRELPGYEVYATRTGYRLVPDCGEARARKSAPHLRSLPHFLRPGWPLS
jgi:protein-S-isoprenylcysteine O-methyltransferase Ste14